MDSESSETKSLCDKKVKRWKCRRKCVHKRRANTEIEIITKLHKTRNKCPEESYRRTHHTLTKDRIVPTCFRSKCQQLYSRTESDLIPLHKSICAAIVNKRKRKKIKRKRTKCESNKSRHCKKHCQHHHRNKWQRDVNDSHHILLSPISLSPLRDDASVISYDAISTDTVSSYSTSKIDTLIKKTRERERRSMQEWPLLPKLFCQKHTSTQANNSDNESIHSAATLILDGEQTIKDFDVCDVVGPKIKKEILEENNNTCSDYMKQHYEDIYMIKTEGKTEKEAIYSKSNLVLQSEEISTNVCSLVKP